MWNFTTVRRCVLALCLLTAPAFGQFFAYNGQCSKGGQTEVTQGLVATATQPLSGGSPALGTGVIASYPSCTVNVFLTGTIIPATLYSCASGISCSLPSQFTANADGSFLFFAASGAYDITTSGAGMPAPFTVTGWQLGASGSGGGLADPGANGIIKRTALNVTAPALFSDVVSLWSSCTSGFLAFNGTCSSGTSGAFEVNTTPLLSTSTINFENSAATNGLTLTFTNPSNGNVQLGLTGTLTNAGLANSAITIGGTSVSLGGSTTSFPAPGPIGGTTPASGAFTTLSASSGITGNLTGNVTGNATTATNAAGLSNCTVATSGSICYWTGTQWQVLSGNASGSLFLQETSAGVPSWTTPPGGGNVSNSGTPTSGQLAYWTGSTTIQGLTTLTAVSEPAHTGDMTNTAGSLATTVAHLNGGLIPASATILGTNGSSQPIATALASTDIFVGNGSNLPVGVAASQDVSLANTGAFTVTGLQTKAIAALSAFTTSPYMTYNGTIWTGANPFASPSFTGTVTFPITGAIQCLRVTAAGVLQGTGADCGTGSGGGNVTGPGSSVVGDVAYFNNTGGSLIADAGYPYNAIPNADLAHSTIGISGTANQITSSTSTPALGGTTTLAIANPFTFPGKWTGAAGTTSASTANVPSGVAPTSPVSGDLWNLSGILQFYDGAHTNSLVTIQAAPTTLHIAQFSGTAGLLQDGGVLGTFAGQNYATPPAIGGTTPAAITGTTITANTGFSGPLNGSVGATTPNTGAFTTLSASSTVSGSGFSTYLASPPAIGGTAPAAGTFTTLSATTLSGTFGGSPTFSGNIAFTGTPTFSHALAFPTGTTCVTQTTGDSSTDCATDAFVINEIGAGTPGTGTVNDLAYWNTGATLGSIGSPVSGQMLVSENGLAPVFSSPTLADSANSPVTSASYTLACDTSTGLVDRTHVVRFQSGASAPIVPLSTFSGCSGMAVKVIDESAGSLTFSRSSPDVFNVYNGSASSVGVNTFTLANGSYATVDQAASGLWEVTIVPGGSGGLSGMTAGQVPIAATATTVTSSEPLAGAGAGIVTGPTSVTSLDVAEFTGTGGQIADSSLLVSNVVSKATTNTFGATGTIDLSASTAAAALKIPSVAGFTSNGTSSIGYDSTAKITHLPTNGADSTAIATTVTDTTTTHAVFATSTPGLYTSRAIAAGDITGAGVTSVTGDSNIITNSSSTGAVTLSIAGTSGGVPYFANGTSWKTSAMLASGNVVIGGGTAAAPFTANNLTWAAPGTFTIGSQNIAAASLILAGNASTSGGTIQLNNTGASPFSTTLGTAATTSNTVNFFAAVPANSDLIYCAVSSTTCTLTDAGYAYNSIPNADLAHSAITIGGTSVSLGGSTSSFPAPGAIGGTTPAAGTFTTLTANTQINAGAAGTLVPIVMGNATSGLLTLQPATGAITSYTLDLPVAQPSGSNTFLSCTAANPAVCTWAAGGGGGVTSVNTLTGAVVIEAATAGQMAVSGGSGAALTGAADMTYSTHTFATTANGIFDWSAATGTAAFKVPQTTTNTATAAGVIDFDTTNKNFHGYVNGGDSIFLNIASAPTTGDVLSATVSSGNTLASDAGFLATNVVRKDTTNVGAAAMTMNMSASTSAPSVQLPAVVGGTILAGTSTANLSAPIVIQNTNSTNNNTSITMGITGPGTSTGQTVLNVNGATTGGDLVDFGTGGTWASGVLSGQTIVAAFTPTGSMKLGTAPTVTTPGTGFYMFGTEGTEPASIGAGTSGFNMDSTAHCPIQWNNAANVGCSAALGAAAQTFTNGLTAPTFTSNVSIGTAPFTVTSTTNVPNLNASTLAGINLGTPTQYGIGYGVSATQIGTTVALTANALIKAGSSAAPSASSVLDDGKNITTSEVFVGGNKVFVTSDFTDSTSASLQLITGLSYTLPTTKAVNVSFHCMLLYDQGSTAVVDEFGIGITGTAPTQANASATVYTSASATTTGTLTALASTTPTLVVSFTPSAITTIWKAELDGTVEQPSNATPGVFGVYAYTTTGSDNLIVKRGSYCEIF